MRLNKDELEKVKKRYKTDRLFSWSMVNTFITSKYEYLLKYILHTPEDRQDCIYTTTGTIAHDILEKLYTGQIQYTDMDEQFEDGWAMAVDIANLKFDRNDEEHNKKLADKYYADLKHFFKNHAPIECKTITEQFVVTKINDYALQGYIDIIFKTSDGVYNIIDFKTSSIYKGKTLEEKSGQLCVYCMGLMQKGVPIDKIRIGFNFLKYVTVEYTQANGTVKTRDIERCELGEKLQSNAKVWLKKLGYEDKVDEYLKDLIDLNDISVLPEDIQAKYKITDCYVYIPLTQQLLDKWVDTITVTIKDILWREQEYIESKNDKLFWDSEDTVKRESYYFATLCSYSPSLHKPYADYLNKLEDARNDTDIFSGIGDSTNSKDNTVIHQNNSNDDINLDWLNDIVV